MNFIKSIFARASGLAKYYHRSELSVLITSQLNIRLMPEWKGRWFEGRLSADSPFSKRVLFEDRYSLHSKCF